MFDNNLYEYYKRTKCVRNKFIYDNNKRLKFGSRFEESSTQNNGQKKIIQSEQFFWFSAGEEAREGEGERDGSKFNSQNARNEKLW